MTDNEIIRLYNERDQDAISATDKKYGAYCMKIALNMLGNRLDSEECVNDTYFRAWNAIPPQVPKVLRIFLGRITRNLSIDRLRNRKSGKRWPEELQLILDELDECVSGKDDIENVLMEKEIANALNEFLAELTYEHRVLFVKRYWYGEKVSAAASSLGMSEGKAASMLMRLRKRLKVHLAEKGIDI